MFPVRDLEGYQTTIGSLDLVVVTVLAEGGLSRSPLVESALTEVCSEIPGAMASSLIDKHILSGGWRHPSQDNPLTWELLHFSVPRNHLWNFG